MACRLAPPLGRRVVSVTPDKTGAGRRVSARCSALRAYGTPGKNKPPHLASRAQVGRSDRRRVAGFRPTADYPLQRCCWGSDSPRFLRSGVTVAEPADSMFRRSRRTRARERISDTRVFRAPAVTKPGTELSVERDRADRPVHERTRVHCGRAFLSRRARKTLGWLVDLVMPRKTILIPTRAQTQTRAPDVRGE